MRNSSLVKKFCAENITGLKRATEAAGAILPRKDRAVGERSHLQRRSTVRTAGAVGSEYAGISNDKTDEKSVRRKPKVSWAMLIIPG